MRSPDNLISGRTISRSALWSALGQIAPAAAGFFAIPFIIQEFGTEKFGLLTLAWVVTGYFSLFDLGLGRAMTKLVAERLGKTPPDGLREHVWTAWILMLALGIAGGIVLELFKDLIVAYVIKGSPAVQGEARRIFSLLALSVPAIVLMTGFRGVLEAGQYFGRVNAVRIPFGIATFLVPLVTAFYTSSLVVAVAGLIIARMVATAVLGIMCFRLLGAEARPSVPNIAIARMLLGFGAWITVSNVIGPIIVLFDRFVVSATISVAIVTYYATPFQVAMQLLILPTAVTAVLFPAFSAAFAHAPAKLGPLFWSGIKLTISVGYPVGVLIIAFAPEILRVWLGGQFPLMSTGTLRWITVGVLMNGVAQFPFALLQSVGHSDFTAKVHLFELPLYFAALTGVAVRFGITGVAAVWAARSFVDLCLMMAGAFRLALPGRREVFALVVSGAIMVVPIGILFVLSSLTVRIVLTTALLPLFIWQAWTRGFEPHQRSAVRSILSSFRFPAVPVP